MQLTLIFTTLVSFAAIAASYSIPKLVETRTSLAKPQIDPGFTAFTGLRMPDTTESIDFEDTLVSSRRSLNSDASGEADRNDDIDNVVHRRSSRDSKSSVSHSTNERDNGEDNNGDDNGDNNDNGNYGGTNKNGDNNGDDNGDNNNNDNGDNNDNGNGNYGGINKNGAEEVDRRRKDVGSHRVHERKAFVYRLKDEKPYN